MKFAFNEEQEELRRQARAFLERNSSSERVRAAMQTDRGYEQDVWRRIGGELGWTAITIPESHGGLGLGYVELVALFEEAGRVLLCSPLFSTVALAANALLAAEDTGTASERAAELLPRIAAGETTATLAYTEENGSWDPAAIATTARRDRDEYVLDGVKAFVPDGHSADWLIVAARAPGSSGDAGLSLFALPGDAAGVTRRLLPTMDQTRKQAEVFLDSVRLPVSALLGPEGRAWPSISRTLDLAAIALAAEQVGGAQRCLDMTVAYAKDRKQFGRPIGSFQAIKHKCADMLLRVESARSAAYYAGWAASVGESEVPAVASLAKAYCSEAYFHCASEAIQIHGGVGFTWEYDVHLHFKRARSTETFLGSPAHHRELVARRIGL
jgi:alkylation response protein AidB-like acyl-CoA dehydrogenase